VMPRGLLGPRSHFIQDQYEWFAYLFGRFQNRDTHVFRSRRPNASVRSARYFLVSDCGSSSTWQTEDTSMCAAVKTEHTGNTTKAAQAGESRSPRQLGTIEMAPCG
jgi:hypothetical protein